MGIVGCFELPRIRPEAIPLRAKPYMASLCCQESLGSLFCSRRRSCCAGGKQ